MLTIDGSKGEGGGQIVRSALGLAVRTGTAVTLENIRAGRRKPGLKRQHLTAVQAAARVGAARVEGAELNSGRLVFEPQAILGGTHEHHIGSAGSATLVLQTVIPALLAADGPSTVVVTGGTHNDLAPPFDFLERVWLPLLNRMGAQIELRLERAGFYPAGGGRIVAEISPGPLSPITLDQRGEITARRVRALLANLPGHIGQREAETACAALGWEGADARPDHVTADGPGNMVIVEVICAHAHALFSAVGRRGKRAEQVAEQAAAECAAWLAHDVPVGPHLADQLILPLALAGGGGFRTVPPTEHTRTQARTVQRFLPDLAIALTPEDQEDGPWALRVSHR